jgi:DNA integrity scanning protein DisA with diadenylate cyclase activity
MSPHAGRNERVLRTAIYQSCLDASFARTGACIGLLRHDHIGLFRTDGRVNSSDSLDSSPEQSEKARAAKAIIGASKFQELNRLVRKDILSLDGATVLSSNGSFLAAGAILRLTEVETQNQGGRAAAAKTLAPYGLGIKVSQDGTITAFQLNDSEPLLSIG